MLLLPGQAPCGPCMRTLPGSQQLARCRVGQRLLSGLCPPCRRGLSTPAAAKGGKGGKVGLGHIDPEYRCLLLAAAHAGCGRRLSSGLALPQERGGQHPRARRGQPGRLGARMDKVRTWHARTPLPRPPPPQLTARPGPVTHACMRAAAAVQARHAGSRQPASQHVCRDFYPPPVVAEALALLKGMALVAKPWGGHPRAERARLVLARTDLAALLEDPSQVHSPLPLQPPFYP